MKACPHFEEFIEQTNANNHHYIAVSFSIYNKMFTGIILSVGAIWGHLIMGLDFTLPSMIGFVSLAGIMVNDSILLVIFVKHHVEEGMSFLAAAGQAV